MVTNKLFLHLVVVTLGVGVAQAELRQARVSDAPELDAGFHLLYELQLEEARAQFPIWQRSRPEDPLGSASEAASYLFEECYRREANPDQERKKGWLRRNEYG